MPVQQINYMIFPFCSCSKMQFVNCTQLHFLYAISTENIYSYIKNLKLCSSAEAGIAFN